MSDNRCYATSDATVKFPNKRTLLMNTFICELDKKKEKVRTHTLS